MLKKLTYVRCPIDSSYPDDPREFILGQVTDINDFSETAQVSFYDLEGLRQYYHVPETLEFPFHKLQPCRIAEGASVRYKGRNCTVIGYERSKTEQVYYYYLKTKKRTFTRACETEIQASFNGADISPSTQLKTYEFHNPMWLLGRELVTKTTHTIESSVYGFKELAGCKIHLKPYQLKTVMRCLSSGTCRYMIADEVGLGKTIEAAAVVKVFLSDRTEQKVLILVPDALTEQWRTELAFKFRLFEGLDSRYNQIDIVPASKMFQLRENYDLCIIDEVHRFLRDNASYGKAMELSLSAKHVIMLSATPVQSRGEEYHRLLSLIQPEKYANMPESDFSRLLELQNSIVRKVYSLLDDQGELKEGISDTDEELTEDTEEYLEEISDLLEDIYDITNDKRIRAAIDQIGDEHSPKKLMQMIEMIIAYICETYQLEKCVIRNRRSAGQDSNTRQLTELSYSLGTDINNTEFRVYSLLSDWLENIRPSLTEYEDIYLPLISAFFSSAHAFKEKLGKIAAPVPEELTETTERWVREELLWVNDISSILDDPQDSMPRLLTIIDYIDQNAFDKKILIFTHYEKTFELYQTALLKYFGKDACAFFKKGMKSDELELGTYRFQTEKSCHIMLSDETGGEGRNFQSADQLINIDLPWSANTMEQRIGRLDRVGRDKSKPVVSVIVYAKDTVENDLANIWDKGLGIFTASQSGLEIIMNDIDEKIKLTVSRDLKYGLSSLVDEITEEINVLGKKVKEERHFDIAAYQYQYINRQIERSIKKYAEQETQLFADSMMSWTHLAGLNPRKVSEDVVSFSAGSFSYQSAFNTLLVPPDMKKLVNDRLNQMQNHIRELNGDPLIKQDPNVIRGTFNRTLALGNDYIHFFAPGDEIFDTIVNNAVNAYKGRSTAFAIEAPFNWEGFILNWYVSPDELLLLKNKVPLRMLDQYRGALSSELMTFAVPMHEDSEVNAETVLRTYNKIPKLRSNELRNLTAHYGKRGKGRDFLGIREKYAISNLEWFKMTYGPAAWREQVDNAVTTSKVLLNEMLEKRKRTYMKRVSSELKRSTGVDASSAEYFGEEFDLDRREQMNKIIYSALAKPRCRLDSICYMRMIKNER